MKYNIKKLSLAALTVVVSSQAFGWTAQAKVTKIHNYNQISAIQRKKVQLNGAWHYDAKKSPSVYVRVYRNMTIKNNSNKTIKFEFKNIKYYRKDFPKNKSSVVFPHKAVIVKPGEKKKIYHAFDVFGQQSIYDPTMTQYYYYVNPNVKVIKNSQFKH
ncbi:hypothetical protein [Lentilactobacillus sp. Marseille-Q4993]|uniref:hypothetical protein n=1 Tax=Lentilactobacillus sp. Marseille-Q4993 TaxID=3039492 RepID=UPI0024BC337F|nr:hypothetical protein [Lentilactobacillus sp. Marseille-Q4993]